MQLRDAYTEAGVAVMALASTEQLLQHAHHAFTHAEFIKILRKEDLDAWRASGYEYTLRTDGILFFPSSREMTILPRRV